MITASLRPRVTPPVGSEQWRQKVPAVMYTPAVSADTSLVAASDYWPGGTLTLLDRASGKASSTPLPDPPQSPISIASDNQSVIYIGKSNGLTRFSLSDNKNLWQSPYSGNLVLPPTLSPDGGQVALAGRNGPVAFNLADGKPLWQHPIGDMITTSEQAYSPDGKTVGIICTADDPDLKRTVDVCDAASGKPAYKALIEERDNDQSPIVVDVHDLATDAVVRKLQVVPDPHKDGDFNLVDVATNQVAFHGTTEVQVVNGMPVSMDFKITDPKTGQDRYKAYLRQFEPGQDAPKHANLYLLDAASGQAVARPLDMGVGYDGNNYWRDYHLAFAPDGKSIAVTRNENAATTVALYDLNTLSKTWQSAVIGKTSPPVFNSDGSQVAVTSLQFKRKDPGSPWLYPTQYAIQTFDAKNGQQFDDDVISASTDTDSVSKPFFVGDQVCAVDVDQKNQEAALVAFPVQKQ